ncbi:hypothetical protein [Clostridium intestinale]|uniref:Uncharacterized protein n=1 Tax=Clostridium intestinale URNW TaxID=1294142 RepID=U2PP52_9CLOT|nr:hypothetical protein [Clostridium intestinale]ERK28215.1 hypothetical protein CINTURNW_4629 [Clostridium intestinale URNW]
MGGTSLIPAEVMTLITGFAGDIVPTALAVVAVVVPVGLALWGVGFAIKKGIGFLQRKASKAL